MAEVRAQAFSLQLQGIGFFPPRGSPRVVWVGLRKNEELLRLHNRIESVLVRAGLAPEDRKYSPHITLARLKNTPASRVGADLAQHGLFRTEEFPVNQFLLYSSVLNSRGARHYIEGGIPWLVPIVARSRGERNLNRLDRSPGQAFCANISIETNTV